MSSAGSTGCQPIMYSNVQVPTSGLNRADLESVTKFQKAQSSHNDLFLQIV